MSDIDLSDPTTLHGIYLVLAEKLLSIHPGPPDYAGIDPDEMRQWAIDLIKEQHEAGRITITADGDTWRTDVAERH